MISCVDGEKRGVSTRSSPRVEITHVGAVLVHDGEPLDAAFRRPGFVDEHDAGVEITLFAGEPFVDGVRDDVGDAAPIVGRGEILLAGELLAGEHVPEPELGLQAAVALAGDASGGKRLRVDGAPIGKVRHGVNAGDFLEEGGGIDRREQAAALEVGGDDLGHAKRGVVVGRGAAHEIGNGDRQRLEVALGHVEADHRGGVTGRQGQAAGQRAERQHASAGHGKIRPVRRRS